MTSPAFGAESWPAAVIQHFTEGTFAVLKQEHCISKIRKRGIATATEECFLTATASNLKRMVRVIFYKLKIQLIWAEAVFPQPSFPFCQQVLYCALSQKKGCRL
ncbi:transposase [uncultured Dysosmobacter sp.]|uniref:transposase n=1 Tax=uncultured Dysosmobacter sp. TaxID=2591384 RepID=UPI002606B430|nr:transposase [uncultured Dysosmobacter sp.]